MLPSVLALFCRGQKLDVSADNEIHPEHELLELLFLLANNKQNKKYHLHLCPSDAATPFETQKKSFFFSPTNIS